MALAGMTKAELTRASIVDTAVAMAQEGGLESLTIGSVAERTGLSKSGVFSRLGSREDLQLAALQEYARRMVERVFMPALREPRGLPRLRRLWTLWLEQVRGDELKSSCLFMSGALEYDDRPGPVRDAVVAGLAEWRRQLVRTIKLAVDEQHLRADTDADQLAFELISLVYGVHNDTRLFRDPRAVAWAQAAFERLITAHAVR
jgi:AcrR family transcriptional regulator